MHIDEVIGTTKRKKIPSFNVLDYIRQILMYNVLYAKRNELFLPTLGNDCNFANVVSMSIRYFVRFISSVCTFTWSLFIRDKYNFLRVV